MSGLTLGSAGLSAPDENSPIYEVPYGTVQLASHIKSDSGNFDVSNSLSVPVDYENQDEEDDEEGDGDDDEVDSEDTGKKGAKKGKKSRSEAKGERDAKTGRRKIKIAFIGDDARRHITFSKRKAGIMKKAYELATLTGTQVLLLVVSQTGLVYTFTTPKLQALVTEAEGRDLIQACLNSPDPPQITGDSGQDDHSLEDGSEDDDGPSPPTSQASGKKRAALSKKRSRIDITKPSSAPLSSTQDGETVPPTLGKRGRGRPRKSTIGGTSSVNDSSAAAMHSGPSTVNGLAPPPPLHQRYSDSHVPQLSHLQQHHLHQQHHQPQHQHQQQQHQHSAYGHVNPSDFTNYGAPSTNYYPSGSMSNPGSAQEMNFAHQPSIPNSLAVDAAHAAWNPSISPQTNTQPLFADAQHQSNYAAFAAAQHQQQHPHFTQFSPQQMGAMQSQEIQAPRPAW